MMSFSFCRNLMLLTLSVCGLLSSIRAEEKTYQPFDPAMSAGARYTISAERLHPTQFALGFREMWFKRDNFDRATRAEVTKTLKKKDLPVIIGPGGVPYMSDGHHTIRSLLESKHADKTVYGTIIANWSHLPAEKFWRQMVEKNYANLTDSAGRSSLDPALLPATLRDMQHDHYRGLAWAVMKEDGFDERKDVYFQEFRWADFFRTRVQWDDTSDTDFQRALKEALDLAKSSEAAKLPGYRAAIR